MSQLLTERAETIFCEMMSHPVLFTHPHPKKIALIGDENHRILLEVLKHPTVLEVHSVHKKSGKEVADSRVQYHEDDIEIWIKNQKESSFDILILATDSTPSLSGNYYLLLHNDGILLQQSESIFDEDKLRLLTTHFKEIGFCDCRILQFPQPNYTSGWRSAVMALKKGIFGRTSEKAIFNKSFNTHFYNFDMHNAATALPEFMRNTSIEPLTKEGL